MISDFSSRITKSGRNIGSFTLSDYGGEANVIVFESSLLRYQDIIKNGNAVAVTANLSAKEDGDGCELLLSGVVILDELKISPQKTLYLKILKGVSLENIKNLCAEYKGVNKLCIYMEETSTVLKSDKDHGVLLNEELFDKLCSILGSENVKIK